MVIIIILTFPHLPPSLPLLGAMVRKGQSGKAKDDGMTDELSAKIRFSHSLFPSSFFFFFFLGVLSLFPSSQSFVLIFPFFLYHLLGLWELMFWEKITLLWSGITKEDPSLSKDGEQ